MADKKEISYLIIKISSLEKRKCNRKQYRFYLIKMRKILHFCNFVSGEKIK